MSKINVNTVDTQCGSTLTLGSSGKTVTLASGASQSGFGRTGTVDWCTTAKTSPFTAVSGNGYFINTTSGAVTVTLPASPSAGDIIAIKDYANTWDTNNVTVGRNGSKIGGECADATLSTESQSVTLIYVDGTKGWQDIHDSTSDVQGQGFVAATGGTVLTNGNFKTHIFTGDGCFSVTSAGNAAGSDSVDYFVVAGGSSGGLGRGGGGGAGGFRISAGQCIPAPTMSPLGACVSALPVSVQTYPITIGGGGAGKTFPATPNCGNSGTNSVFSTITSAGGGGGANGTNAGGSGGSGGGAAYAGGGSPGAAGSGNTPPVSPPQGQPGGTTTATGSPTPTPQRAGGAGGGAGGAGGNSAPGGAGKGGIGSFIADPFIGPTAPSYGTAGPVSSVRYFAGGGGAGMQDGSGGAAPDGGGGTAGKGTTVSCNATANTGGSSGGSGEANPGSGSGNGGSGVVMIRYKFQ
jgi:hypothetical protein